MDKFETNRMLHIVTVNPAQPEPINSYDLLSLLTYGGVAVAIIIALTYYNRVLLELIKKLLSSDGTNK